MAVDASPETDSALFAFIRDFVYASTIRINPPFLSPGRGSSSRDRSKDANENSRTERVPGVRLNGGKAIDRSLSNRLNPVSAVFLTLSDSFQS